MSQSRQKFPTNVVEDDNLIEVIASELGMETNEKDRKDEERVIAANCQRQLKQSSGSKANSKNS